MQSVSSRVWTRVAVSISYDDNHYTHFFENGFLLSIFLNHLIILKSIFATLIWVATICLATIHFIRNRVLVLDIVRIGFMAYQILLVI